MSRLMWNALCVTVALLMARTSADYSKKDDVMILTEKNFEKEVLNSPDFWLVEFYAPWYVVFFMVRFSSD